MTGKVDHPGIRDFLGVKFFILNVCKQSQRCLRLSPLDQTKTEDFRRLCNSVLFQLRKQAPARLIRDINARLSKSVSALLTTCRNNILVPINGNSFD